MQRLYILLEFMSFKEWCFVLKVSKFSLQFKIFQFLNQLKKEDNLSDESVVDEHRALL